MGRTFKAAWLGAAALMLSACGEETKTTVTPDAGTVKPPGSIVAVASGDPQFSTLVAAVEKAGLAETLADETKKYTVFAPTNAAFQALLTDLGITNGLEGLTAAQLKPILLYHVLGSEIRAAAATTAAQSNAKVEALGGKVALSVVEGKIVLDGSARVATADVLASNGVIHVIDRVILPSITDLVTTSAQFSSLAGAIVAADGAQGATVSVAGALDGEAVFTLFAPTNAAFAALGAAPSGQALTDVLLYHAVGQAVYGATAAGLAAPLSVSTALASKSLTVAAGAPGAVTVADGTAVKANVVATDYFTSNGVIHAVDKVLIP